MRGLDLALEEGLNVKLVLLPNQEDPDSYINKNGADSFHRIHSGKIKKILFYSSLNTRYQMPAMIPHKRAQVVNQIAESISKINKTEDFTKQQDYIRKTAELLKIDEGGLHNLVNKHTREKLGKDEKKSFSPNEAIFPGKQLEIQQISGEETDALGLLKNDVYHERAVVRCLLEFGLKEWEDQEKR